MVKIITVFTMKVIALALIGGCVAFIIWYFFSARTSGSLSEMFLWCGIAIIAIGVLLFAGHTDIDSAPMKSWDTAGAIDKQDMDYARDLRRRSEALLLMMSLAGALLMVVSWLLM